MSLKPVVAGVDGSQESLRAVEWAALEARRHGAPLRIVSAPALLPRMSARAQVPETVAVRQQDQSWRALEEALTRAREMVPGQLADVALLAGPPALALAHAGASARMLVVGARGAGGFAAMVLGSVSRYVAMQARCPVVVVRQETGAVHREVVVGIRDPHDAGATLAYAFDEAERRKATLIAVHSWSWLSAEGTDGQGLAGALTGHAADTERVTAEADRYLSEALRPWRERHPAVPVWQDVVHDHPAHVLASYSARADLVVIGRYGTPGSLAVVGGVQHALLNHARGPVAIIPAVADTPAPRSGAAGRQVPRARQLSHGH